MSDKTICQICSKDLSEVDFEAFDEPQILDFVPSKTWYRICSYACQKKALQFNGAWNMAGRLKNVTAVPFTVFQEAFNMPEAGGYAEDKHKLMVSYPLAFLHSLDIENFKKFMDMKL